MPGDRVRCLGIIPVSTVLDQSKIVRRVTGFALAFNCRVRGYEIHVGRTTCFNAGGRPFALIHEPGKKASWEEGWVDENYRIIGTYIHGVLDSPTFRGEILNKIRLAKGLKPRIAKGGRMGRFRQYDKLADHFEAHCDVDKILAMAGIR